MTEQIKGCQCLGRERDGGTRGAGCSVVFPLDTDTFHWGWRDLSLGKRQSFSVPYPLGTTGHALQDDRCHLVKEGRIIGACD